MNNLIGPVSFGAENVQLRPRVNLNPSRYSGRIVKKLWDKNLLFPCFLFANTVLLIANTYNNDPSEKKIINDKVFKVYLWSMGGFFVNTIAYGYKTFVNDTESIDFRRATHEDIDNLAQNVRSKNKEATARMHAVLSKRSRMLKH